MEEQKNRLYVGNLPYSVADQDLSTLFADYEVVDSKVIVDKFSNRSKGFGFVTLKDEAAAEKAVSEMNGKELEGLAIVVNVARPMEKRDNR